MGTCSIDAIKKQRLDENVRIFKGALKDVTMKSIGSRLYKLTPKYGAVDVYKAVSDARNIFNEVLKKELFADPSTAHPQFTNHWTKTTNSAYNHMTIEFTIPELWENAIRSKMGEIDITDVLKVKEVPRYLFFKGDRALMEQDERDVIDDQEREAILSGAWDYDPKNDTGNVISNSELYRIKNQNNKC